MSRTGDARRDAGVRDRVSIVVLTHQRREELLATLTRLTSMAVRVPIIVVDNGSTDGTATAVRAQFRGVDVIRLGANAGAAGRNAGVLRASTPYVALCDDDTWWADGALPHAVDLLEHHPRLALVTGHVLVGPDQRDDPACTAMAGSPLPRTPDLPGVPVLGFMAGASIVRRQPFLDVGGFEPRFFLGGEEQLVAVDLASRGGALAYVPSVRAHHHPSPSRDAARRRHLLARNALWFAWLRRPLAGAIARTRATLSDTRDDPVARGGVVEALYGLPWVLRRRRVVSSALEAQLQLIESTRGIPRTDVSGTTVALAFPQRRKWL